MRVGVIGAGPAGCLVARRLADAGHQVTLHEAGERIPPTLDFLPLLDDPSLRWPGAESDPIRAKVLGGASAINGMLASAPDTVDLAAWDLAAGVEAGWARASLERVIAEVAPQIAVPGPLARAMTSTALEAGDRLGGSTLDVDARGVLVAALSARSGERRDGVAVYLDEAPAGLVVATGSTITSLDDPRLEDCDHVVVSAGALASPSLVASAVPGLHLHTARQHRAIAVPIALDPDQRVERDQPAVSRVLRWASGVDDSGRADVQIVILDHLGWSPEGRSTGLAIVSLLAGTDLGTLPATDAARLRVGVRRLADLLDAAGLNDRAGPSAGLADDTLDAWISAQPNPVHHVSSTLPLGQIVGPAGLVDGRTDLSVIDASVLPEMPRADTHIPVLAIADLLTTQLLDHLA